LSERLVDGIKRVGQHAIRAIASHGNYHIVRGMADRGSRPDPRLASRATPWSITYDYVRNGTLELLCREIRESDVPGDIAELGVFRGDFAWLMKEHLPDRQIHLFDTFRGFDEGDFELDSAGGLAAEFFDFSGTDSATVRSRFTRPELVEIHDGYFPATAEGLEDKTFALVSIDADLYAPVLSGLRWFHERLSPGGYILVHDYNNEAFAGAKKAVQEFVAGSDAFVVPIPDWGGTAVVG
jgi:O-methyltransferase